MKKIITLILIGLAISLISVSAKPVDLQMGARAFGMGGAFAAISDDATSTYWNPAGLAQLKGITFSETNWILADVDNVNVNYISGVVPISYVGTIGVGWLLQHATLEQGQGATYKETSWNENSFSLAAGRQLWESMWIFKNTAVGFSLNRHLIDAESDNGAGTGFDFGVLTGFPYGIKFAVVAKSMATDMMGDKIEPEYRMGLGYTWNNNMHKVVGAMDFLFKQDIEYEHSVTPVDDFLGGNHKFFQGLEYQFSMDNWSVAVRAGGNRVVNSDRENTVITMGLGFIFSGISAQYAFQTNTETDLSIGNTHRITLELELEKFMTLVKKE